MPTGYDVINHVVAVRMRIQGSGEFHSSLHALENDPNQNLVDSILQTTNPRPVNLLANLISTRIQFRGSIDGIDEYFIIKNITLYGKPTSTGYPQ